MAGLCEGGNEPPGSLKVISKEHRKLPSICSLWLRENPGKNLNQVTCPDRDSNPSHLVSRPDALTVTPQVWTPEPRSEIGDELDDHDDNDNDDDELMDRWFKTYKGQPEDVHEEKRAIYVPTIPYYKDNFTISVSLD
ncbi:hypothetical protein ANN_15073 [Periplaneta americana]|uniref:Uncharacterized protein n=1 Tax=Periplaneta americana TaxID=6978 RepID=A0ABQ8SZA7_PERAM|nr:hypothetical protein ANN_15073 [Periplaneta americana]